MINLKNSKKFKNLNLVNFFYKRFTYIIKQNVSNTKINNYNQIHFNNSLTNNFLSFNYKNFARVIKPAKSDKPAKEDLTSKSSSNSNTKNNPKQNTTIDINTPVPNKPKTKKIMTELDIQAFKEELKFLAGKNDHIGLYTKLTNKISYFLNGELSEQDILRSEELVVMLSEILRDLDRVEESMLKQKEVLFKIMSIESEAAYHCKAILMDRISFDNLVMQNFDEALHYSTSLVELVKKRVQEDRISLIDDQCYLVAMMLNLSQVKIEMGASNDDILTTLKEVYELFKQNKNKLESLGFKLLRSLGVISYEVGDYEESIQSLQESLKYKRLVGLEDDGDCSLVYKCLGDNYVRLANLNNISSINTNLDTKESDDKKIAIATLQNERFNTALDFYKKSIELKQDYIEDLTPEQYEDEAKTHFIEIGKTFEVIADCYNEYHKDYDKCIEYINKAFEHYLKFPIEGIFLSKCYLMLADISLEKKEWEKTIEYSKKYIKAFEKFVSDHGKEFDTPGFDLEFYTKSNIPTHHTYVYRSYKHLAISYSALKDKQNSLKYAKLAIDKLNELNKGEGEDDPNYETSDFINYKYELMKIYESIQNWPMAIKECDEIITKLNSNKNDKVQVESEQENNFIKKHYFLVDCLYNKADLLIKMEKFAEAKNLLGQLKEMIHKENLKIDEEREEDIDKKFNLIKMKLRSESTASGKK